MTDEINKLIYEKQERKAVKDYIVNLLMLEGQTFEHQLDGRIYTVQKLKASKDFEDMFIITENGIRMPLEACLSDLEVLEKK